MLGFYFAELSIIYAGKQISTKKDQVLVELYFFFFKNSCVGHVPDAAGGIIEQGNKQNTFFVVSIVF